MSINTNMGKSTNLFKQRFKHYLMEGLACYKKLKKIKSEDENTVGGGALGPAAAVGQSQSGDWYAPGDYRKPYALGAVQTRRGPLKAKKTKKAKKKKRNKKS